MIKIYLVDDEPHALKRLESLLTNFPELEVTGKSTTVDDAISGILKIDPDLIFLDVEIINRTGFEVLETIREKGSTAQVIFVTGYSHYSIKALREKALDYLLKPVDLDELINAIDSFKTSNYNIRTEKKINNYSFLTDQEKVVLIKMIKAKKSKQIGEEMNLSLHTIETYRRRILSKFNVTSTVELMAKILSD